MRSPGPETTKCALFLILRIISQTLWVQVAPTIRTLPHPPPLRSPDMRALSMRSSAPKWTLMGAARRIHPSQWRCSTRIRTHTPLTFHPWLNFGVPRPTMPRIYGNLSHRLYPISISHSRVTMIVTPIIPRAARRGASIDHPAPLLPASADQRISMRAPAHTMRHVGRRRTHQAATAFLSGRTPGADPALTISHNTHRKALRGIILRDLPYRVSAVLELSTRQLHRRHGRLLVRSRHTPARRRSPQRMNGSATSSRSTSFLAFGAAIYVPTHKPARMTSTAKTSSSSIYGGCIVEIGEALRPCSLMLTGV